MGVIHFSLATAMASVKIRDIPYLPDSAAYYQVIRDLPCPIWLDSGRPHAQFGRYDILSAQPRSTLLTTGVHTVAWSPGGKFVSDANPFDLVDDALVEMGLAELQVGTGPDLPFCGGAMGYFGYNLRPHLEPSSPPVSRDIGLPDMAIGLYDWAFIQDHLLQRSWLVALPGCPETRIAELVRRATSAVRENTGSANSFKISKLESNFDVDTYYQKLAQIQDYIQAGDCYQVNFAQRFSGRFEGDPFSAYCHLRQLLPAPYAAFMEVEGGAVLSHSPEQFLKLSDGKVETKPIKGTAPRDPNPQRDCANAERLCQSEKDRAENLMIVDLLRNDLGKTCQFGSVHTPSLFALESYANVHHLVSTVSGHLRPEYRATDLLKGCFPGGSITGAPKVRAMEIIAELENCDRSVYCGSIGYLSVNGNMDSNIAIRTLVCTGDTIHCWGGGGIVADSEPDAEYAESLTKIDILLKGLTEG